MVRILESEDYYDMAQKIFYQFEVNQSCTIGGWVVSDDDAIEKGEMVCNELRRLDTQENVCSTAKKPYRKRKIIPDSIGGYMAHKIFKYKRVILDNRPKWTIWRLQ